MTTVIDVKLADPNSENPNSVRRAVLTLNKLIQQLMADDLVIPQNVLTSDANEDITAGMAVYMNVSGDFCLAKADSTSTSSVIGLAVSDVSSGNSASVISSGSMVLDDWTDVVGGAELTPGVIYYLSPTTAGLLTSTRPTGSGEVVAPVGIAESETVLVIRIGSTLLRS